MSNNLSNEDELQLLLNVAAWLQDHETQVNGTCTSIPEQYQDSKGNDAGVHPLHDMLRMKSSMQVQVFCSWCPLTLTICNSTKRTVDSAISVDSYPSDDRHWFYKQSPFFIISMIYEGSYFYWVSFELTRSRITWISSVNALGYISPVNYIFYSTFLTLFSIPLQYSTETKTIVYLSSHWTL